MVKNSNIKITVIGSDARQSLVAAELIKQGRRVRIFGAGDISPPSEDTLFDAVQDADVVVLPLPASRDGYRLNAEGNMPFEEFTSLLPDGCRVFAGRLQPALKELILHRGIELFDFYGDAEFSFKNTEISSEGAIFYLSEILRGLKGKRLLVCGYGLFGEALARGLSEKGALVHIAARRDESLSKARKAGFGTKKIDLAKKCFFTVDEDFDGVLNTVPYHIFTNENAQSLKGKIYLELASAPFGAAPERLEGLCRYVYLPGIPARYAPKRAGQAMLSSLLRYIGRIEEQME